MKSSLSLLAALLLTPPAVLHAADKPAQLTRPDIVLADFEQGYGNWTVEGEALNHPTTRFLPPERQAFTGIVPIHVGASFDNIPLDFLPISLPPVGHAGKGLADSWDPSYFINDGYEAGNRYLAGFRPEGKQALSLQGDSGMIFKTFQVRALRPTWKAK